MAFFRAIVRHPLPVLALIAALSAGLGSQLPQLHFDSDTESYVPQGHPARDFWDEARERFGLGGRIVVAVVTPEASGVFSPVVLAGVAELTGRIQGLERLMEEGVRSVANSDAIIGSEEGMEVVPLFERPPRTRAEIDRFRQLLYSNNVYVDRLISQDGSITTVLVDVDFYLDDHSLIYWDLVELLEDFEIPGARILIAGTPAVEAVYGRQMVDDLRALVPLALMVVVAVLYLCFPTLGVGQLLLRTALVTTALVAAVYLTTGKAALLTVVPLAIVAALLPARGVFLPSLVVVLSLLWTWGLQAALGIPVYLAAIIMPPILLAIGCADGIHILERYNEKALLHEDREEVVLATMGEMWRPVVLTSVTTAIGFAALATGKMAAFQVLGVFSAVGIIAAMVLSLTLIPALLAVMPLPQERSLKRSTGLSVRALSALSSFVSRRRLGVSLTGAVAAVVFLGGAALLRIDYSWVESLAPGTPVLLADRYLRERHGGTMPLNVIVRAPESGGIKDPALLRSMDTVLSSLADDATVGDTRSIVEYIKRMNQVMSEDRPEAYRVPHSRDLVAQYLLLHTMSAGPGELDDMVDYDYQAANLSILLRRDSMASLSAVLADTDDLLDRHLRARDGVTATMTGSAHIMHIIMSMVFEAQVYSLTIASVLVFTIMILLFRSLADTLLCMVPSAFAAIANFGTMGLLGVALGPSTVIISAIALGIGVDYAIHLVTRFRELSRPGTAAEQTLVEAMRSVGCSILFNALVVVAGFAVLVFSRSPSNVMLGALVAFNMATTAIAALTVLPALLLIDGKRRAVRGQAETAPWFKHAA